MINIKLTDAPNVFSEKVLASIAKQLNKSFKLALPGIQREVISSTENFFALSQTAQDLVTGDLRGHFGFPIGSERERADALLKAAANQVEVQHRRVSRYGKRLVGGITVRVLKHDVSELVALPEATIITEKGVTLNWVEWLLTRGNQIIVSNFEIEFMDNAGRSNIAVMIEQDGGVWKVPREYAGVEGDNFMTRLFSRAIGGAYANDLFNIVERNVKKFIF